MTLRRLIVLAAFGLVPFTAAAAAPDLQKQIDQLRDELNLIRHTYEPTEPVEVIKQVTEWVSPSGELFTVRQKNDVSPTRSYAGRDSSPITTMSWVSVRPRSIAACTKRWPTMPLPTTRTDEWYSVTMSDPFHPVTRPEVDGGRQPEAEHEEPDEHAVGEVTGPVGHERLAQGDVHADAAERTDRPGDADQRP